MKSGLPVLVLLFVVLVGVIPVRASDAAKQASDKAPKLIAPAVSTGTGLLLEPALTLPEFKPLEFEGFPIVANSPQFGPDKSGRCGFYSRRIRRN